MNKATKTILMISMAIFGAAIFSVGFTQAQTPDNLIVQFEQTPLFNEANFLPGQSVTRWVKITNNSDQPQRIATEAINYNKPIPANDLSQALNLEIKEGGVTRYSDVLSKFFATGEVFLSNLANDSTTTYDFTVSFWPGTNNNFQGATTTFDILIGFQGTAGGIAPGAGGGTGGYLPPGLSILEESATSTAITATSTTITWTTSYFSTSQVIYDTVPKKFNLAAGPPNYGYTYSKEGDDSGLEKVTGHSVTITGLTPNTKYYYRSVSHGSLAISQEYSFTTLGEKVEEKRVEEEIPQGITKEEVPLASPLVETEKPSAPEEAAPPEEEIVTVPPTEKLPEEGLAPLFLASLEVIQQSAWMKFALILSLLGLTAIGIKEWKLAGKNKKIC